MSRSIFTSANSRFRRASSISFSLNGLYLPPNPDSLPALWALTQLPKVDGASDNRLPASGIDNPPSTTSLTASSLNSFVYLPYGILYFLTPPSLIPALTLVSSFFNIPHLQSERYFENRYRCNPRNRHSSAGASGADRAVTSSIQTPHKNPGNSIGTEDAIRSYSPDDYIYMF
jgi:hypothetical protein